MVSAFVSVLPVLGSPSGLQNSVPFVCNTAHRSALPVTTASTSSASTSVPTPSMVKARVPNKRRRRTSSSSTSTSNFNSVPTSSTVTATVSVPSALSTIEHNDVNNPSSVPSPPPSPTTVDSYSSSASLALDDHSAPNVLLSLPDELTSHSLLSQSDQRQLLDDVKFLRELEQATTHLRKHQTAPTFINDTVLASHFHISPQQLQAQRVHALRARDVLVTSNIRLVHSIATAVHRSVCLGNGSKSTSRNETSGVTISDLAQEGTLALIRSAERYDTARNVRFTNYATRAILSACYRAAVPASCIVSIPERLRRVVRRESHFLNKNKITKTKEHAPEHLVQLARKHLRSGVSLNEPASSSATNGTEKNNRDQVTQRMELLTCERPQPHTQVESDIRREEIHAFCTRVLPKIQADVITLKFGLHGLPPMEVKEIAQAHGVSASWINQLLSKARVTLGESWSFFADYFYD